MKTQPPTETSKRPGRPRLEVTHSLTAEEAQARRKKAASLRSRRSQARAVVKGRFPAGGPLLDHELAEIDRRFDAEAQELGLTPPQTKARRERNARRRNPTGEGIRCRFVVHDRADGAYDLDVYEATTSNGTGFATFPYRLNGLTEAQLKRETEDLKTEGFDPARYMRPLQDYILAAHDLKKRQLEGDFDLDEENEAYGMARQAIRDVNRSATVGLFLGLLILSRGQEESVMTAGRGGSVGSFFRVYDAIGDARIPMAQGAFHASVEQWIMQIASEPLKVVPHTGVGRPGKDAASKKQIRFRLQILRDAFRVAATVGGCFPAARSADGILTKTRIKRAIDEIDARGLTRGSIPFRCLYRGELELLMEQVPTLSHAAYLIFCHSTGLRPQHAKMLSTRYFDPETGALSFEKGLLYELRPGGANKSVSRGQESVVVRLILSFPEVFDIGLLPEIARYFAFVMKKNRDLRAFDKDKGVIVAKQRDFRTTCAKSLFLSGVDMTEIALRLGNTVDVAAKHYADNVPPDAVHFDRGPTFFGDLESLKVGGKSVCLEGPAWDGWLLKKFLMECIARKRQEYGDDGAGFEAFKARLSAKVLRAHDFREEQSAIVLEQGRDAGFRSLDDM